MFDFSKEAFWTSVFRVLLLQVNVRIGVGCKNWEECMVTSRLSRELCFKMELCDSKRKENCIIEKMQQNCNFPRNRMLTLQEEIVLSVAVNKNSPCK